MEITFPYKKLKDISIPSAIIHGDKDTHVPYSDSVLYVKNLGGPTQLVTIKGADHGFHSGGEDGIQASKAAIEFFVKNL